MSDMSISEFFNGRSIFITGATGFLGKVLVEKLLRSCPNVRTIYVLLRPKKGQDINQRLDTLLDSQLFDRLKQENPGYKNKVSPISGDIFDDGLGICDADVTLLCNEVSVVFHSAATVKFDEELKLSVQLNVIGVRKMLQLAHKMKRIEAFIHVSTAYANCDRRKVTETVYPPPLHPHKLIDAIEWMHSDVIGTLTPRLIGQKPNTYTYTKATAEYLLTEECGDLPVAIVRPSIIGAAWQEPVPGWVDNFNGPTGLLAAIGKGVLRIMKGDFNAIADIIPVDLTANLLLATAWHTAVHRQSKILVFNSTTGQVNRITWGQIERDSYKYFTKNPMNTIARIPNPHFTKSKLWHELNIVFDHMLPAYIMDFYLWISGRRRMFVRIQERLRKAIANLDYFTCREWEFCSDNINMLHSKLSTEDKKMFEFDPRVISWPVYMENYCLGIKKFLMKEELEELPKARMALTRLKRISMVVNVVVLLFISRLLISRLTLTKSLWQFFIRWALQVFQRLPSFAMAS